MDLKSALKNKFINGWNLFFLVSVPISAFILAELIASDLTTGGGVSHMIGYAVRFAVPLIFLVVAAPALQILFPGPLPNWLLRNRKYVGLSFAVAMAWQGLFIFVMSYFFREYYYEEVYYFRDELEGSVGYLFLLAMATTSFHFGRKYTTPSQWKLLHRSAMYFLWAYPFSTYWWSTAYYYGIPSTMDYVFYWLGFLAVAARIAAWGKQRLTAAQADIPGSSMPLSFRLLGGALIGLGLVAAATGAQWRVAVSDLLTAPAWSGNLELWLPFWPFEPFLPLFIIGFGTLLATRVQVSQESAAATA